ncbi:uncharacterized protein ALTATR162_LOCUS9829 [Alternaria atra]|uniref:chitinase n=1 Tax=Alternaria atra TaxID=119953 RepID=A0A8J2I8M7_9PLEO|nr:uncharacterized protein ALTATR162_LOCUS9829 [Alternaria atra]CAG5181777.1 unnamed protein product [Alternaria atra]
MEFKILLHVFFIIYAGAAVTWASDIIVTHTSDDVTDDLDEWMAAAKRVSPDVLKACPIPCGGGQDINSSAGWFLYSDLTKLAFCNETMLLNMVVQSSLDDDNKGALEIVKACSADYEPNTNAAHVPDEKKASLCTTANRVLENATVFMHQPTADNNDGFSTNHLLAAGNQIANHLSLQQPSCTNNAMEFAYSQSSAVGLFAGAEVHQHGLTSDVLKVFLDFARERSVSQSIVVQLCGNGHRGADYSMGIVATSVSNLQFVKQAVSTWADGGCVSQAGAGEAWMQVTLRVPTPIDSWLNNATNMTSGPETKSPTHFTARSYLSARADCKTITVQSGDGCVTVANRCGISQANLEKYNRAKLCTTLVKDEKVCCSSGTLPSTLPSGNSDGTCKTRPVVSGDTCASLASKCGISAAEFTQVNTKTNLCSSLAPGQQVCCSSGKMPDLKPKPDVSGNCAVYTTKKDDSCSVIAASRDLTVTELESFNKKTWGWNGCKRLFPDFKMCVSTGGPPMPASVPNAVCGPTVNGTMQTPVFLTGGDLSMLNPCPLNVCCNIWGQCGLTDDFCVISKSETGAPGTSAPGENGCISNCGRDIIKGSAPASKIKVAYYESWNFARDCLTMWVDEIDTDAYTHIHFAFANVTRGDYKVEITDPSVMEQFELFKGMTGVKKIVSLGGWAFSTEPGTFSILREAALPANRELFKNNLISFVNEHGLDGIDLDWEYPGAPDIPEIPSDDPVNGVNYYRLLSSLKTSLGSSKTVSFAAPASYWYLKSFPIKQMASSLDYIIYMTYDLHGQWDYGNKWTSPGCDTGNCLRSHVNETETKDALSMITKAGAPSNKVVVGVASYGRSFKMAQAGCDSEQCKFTGSARVSNAQQGRCTATSGYISNAEIDEIIKSGSVNKQWKEEGSNIMVYNDTEWVAWMDEDMKKTRSDFYDSYNFAGTTDWAVDLQSFVDGTGEDDDGDYLIDPDWFSECGSSEFATLQQLEDRKDSIPPHCMEQYILNVQVAIYEDALATYKTLVDGDYDKKFEIYQKFVKAQIPDQIDNFMASDRVDKYFTCKDYKWRTCCSSCKVPECAVDCVGYISDKNCKSGYGDVAMDKCPKMEFGDKGLDVGERIPNVTFTLNDSDSFFKDLADAWGIEESWISFRPRLMHITPNGCQGVEKPEDLKPCLLRTNQYFWNYPGPKEDIEIYNPKDIVGDSYSKANEMLDSFQYMQEFGDYDEEMLLSDLVDATSIPAFAIQEAIESMKQIIDKANDIEKKEREEFILNFITSLLFFIPVVGEAAGAAGLTAARSLLRLIGTAGDAALTLYTVIEDPENALIAVFSYLAGAGVGRSGFKNAAQSRRAISQKDYASLGNVRTKLDTVESLRGAICAI